MQMINPAVGGVNNRLPASVADTALRAARLFIDAMTITMTMTNRGSRRGVL
jgi:hypothetical protein